MEKKREGGNGGGPRTGAEIMEARYSSDAAARERGGKAPDRRKSLEDRKRDGNDGE